MQEEGLIIELTTKIRILQIVPSVSLVYDVLSPSQMVLQLSAALAKLGVNLTIITTDSIDILHYVGLYSNRFLKTEFRRLKTNEPTSYVSTQAVVCLP